MRGGRRLQIVIAQMRVAVNRNDHLIARWLGIGGLVNRIVEADEDFPCSVDGDARRAA